jgi:4-hydroxymandelate oxidase
MPPDEERTMRWIDELPAQAAHHLTPAVYEYFRRGSAAERTLSEAAAAWGALRLRPHVLRDISRVSTATTVLGTAVDTPVLVAPSTLQLQCDPAGEVATAAAVAGAGSLLCVSSNTGVRFAELTGIAPWWIQAYLLRDRGLTRTMLDAATAAGASAVVLTADAPVLSRPDTSPVPDVWATVPPEHTRANWQGTAEQLAANAGDLTFDDITWLRDATGLPIVVKGILRGDDARDAVAAGAAAIWVSNHGGRQLDGAISTTAALPDVAEALTGSGTEIYVDGGIRRGEHVLAALALGARAVFLGRPVLWALAAHGRTGVQRLLTDLTAELAHSLALTGATSPAELTPDIIA